MEALTFGSLMMFASGVVASAPSSASASGSARSPSRSGNCARMRAAREMSRTSTSTPAVAAKVSRMGSSEWVASAGASSV
jgi:hypothetical protein